MAKVSLLEKALKQITLEEFKAAHEAKQEKIQGLQGRKDAAKAQFEALKKEVLEIREIDGDFAFPWKSSVKKKSSANTANELSDADLTVIQEFVKDEPKQLKEVAAKIGAHHFTVKKFLKGNADFKISKKDKKAFISYVGGK